MIHSEDLVTCSICRKILIYESYIVRPVLNSRGITIWCKECAINGNILPCCCGCVDLSINGLDSEFWIAAKYWFVKCCRCGNSSSRAEQTKIAAIKTWNEAMVEFML